MRTTGPHKTGRNESGQIVILTALSMTVMLGIAALSIDVSFLYEKRNRMHAAADAGALSGAIEVQRNSAISSTSLRAFVNAQVSRHGFDPATTTSVTVNRSSTSVEVILSEVTSTFFGRVLGWSSMTPTARAIAGVSGNPGNCIITTAGPGSSPTSFQIGNTALTLNNCNVADSGDLNGTNPNSAISGTPTPPVNVSGTCSGTCGAMGTLTTGVAPPIDPLSGLVGPTNPGGCMAGTAATLNPGCYTSIATSVTRLNSGTYYVTGDVNVGTSLTATGVMLYLTGAGRLTSANNNALHLSAPTSGTYTGIAIFQDKTDTNNFVLGNAFTLDVSGAVYMPGADIDINNHLDFILGNCTLFVAHSLNIRNGSGGMSTSGCKTAFSGAVFLKVAILE